MSESRLSILKAFIKTIPIPDNYDVRYNNEPTYDFESESKIDRRLLRVFVGPSFEKSDNRGCCLSNTFCESTIEIVTPTQDGLEEAMKIEMMIRKAVKSACPWPYNPEYLLVIRADGISTDPQFTENMSRSVLPVNIKYKITFLEND